MKPYKITYKFVGTVTLPVMAHSPEAAHEEAMNEWPETDINFNKDLVVLGREPVCVEDEEGKLTWL